MSDVNLDLDLIHLVAAGSESAMQQLYSKYYEPVKKFIARRLVEVHAQDDVVQETMLSVWRYANSFRGEAKVSTWIFTIAARNAILYNKKLKRRNAIENEPTGQVNEVPDTDKCSFLDAETVYEDQAFFARIRNLSENHKRVVTLKYMLDYSCHEIADLEGCSNNTVKTRLHYARRALSNEMQCAAG